MGEGLSDRESFGNTGVPFVDIGALAEVMPPTIGVPIVAPAIAPAAKPVGGVKVRLVEDGWTGSEPGIVKLRPA